MAEIVAGRRSAFNVCLLVSALATLDISKVNVAIPAIEADLGVGSTEVQLLTAGYVFMFGLALIPAGRFGDMRSRRTMFIIGMSLFGIASLGCALAPTSEFLLFSRALQGISAGLLLPQTLGMIQQLFPGDERGKAFGLYGAMVGLTVAIAPVLGGALVALGGPQWGWRMVFLVNLPILCVCIPLALKYLPRYQPPRSGPKNLDFLGTLLLALTTASFMLPFVFTTGHDTDNPWRWMLMILAVVFGVCFTFWERYYSKTGRTPVLDLELLKIPPFRNGTLIALLYYGGSPSAVLTTTLYFQHALGLGALQAGLSTLPFALSYIVTSSWSGKASIRYGRKLVVVGLLVSFVGWSTVAVCAMIFSDSESIILLPAALLIVGCGAGMISAPNQTMTLKFIPVVQGGLAASISQTAQRLGSSIGVAVSMSLFYGTLSAQTLGRGSETLYDTALRNAFLGSTGLILLALIVASFDVASERRHAYSVPVG